MILLYCNTKIIIQINPNKNNVSSNHVKPFLLNIVLLDNGSANTVSQAGINPKIKNIFMFFTPFFNRVRTLINKCPLQSFQLQSL